MADTAEKAKELLSASVYKVLAEIREGKPGTPASQDLSQAKFDNAKLQKELQAIEAADDEEFARLYKYIGALEDRCIALHTENEELRDAQKAKDSVAIVPAVEEDKQQNVHSGKEQGIVSPSEPVNELEGAKVENENKGNKLSEMEAAMERMIAVQEKFAGQLDGLVAIHEPIKKVSTDILDVKALLLDQSIRFREVFPPDGAAERTLKSVAKPSNSTIGQITGGKKRSAAGQGNASSKRPRTAADERSASPAARKTAAEGFGYQNQLSITTRPLSSAGFLPTPGARNALLPPLPSTTAPPNSSALTSGLALTDVAAAFGSEPPAGEPAQRSTPVREVAAEPSEGARAGPSNAGAEKFKEAPEVTTGQLWGDWLGSPWRCPICCLGFSSNKKLAAHMTSEAHLEFAQDIMAFTFRRNAKDNGKKLPENASVETPFPRANRRDDKMMRKPTHGVWKCQICSYSSEVQGHMMHVVSKKHLSTCESRLKGQFKFQATKDSK